MSEILLVNCKVYTMDEERPEAEAVLVRGDRIAFVGRRSEAERRASRNAVKIDLKGLYVLPGFIDSHTHLLNYGLNLTYSVDLSKTNSLREALEAIRERARETPRGRWILGFGWDESKWVERRYPRREDLDEVSEDHPIALIRVDLHLGVVNSQGLRKARIPEEVRGLDRDSSGGLTGILREEALKHLLQAIKPSLSELIEGLKRGIRVAHSLGITTIHEFGGIDELRAYLELKKRSLLKLRVYFLIYSEEAEKLKDLGLWVGWGDEWLRIGGLKVFIDGSIGARTAALLSDYSDDPGNKGMLVHEAEELEELFRKCFREGVQLAIHAIGDRAIKFALKILSKIVDARRDHRWRMEHLELPLMEEIELMRKLKLIASMQPNFIGEWGRREAMYEWRLGLSRLMRNNPMRVVMDSGVTVCFGSDCMPPSPLYGIYWAVNAPFKAQRISVYDALKCYTVNGAYSAFQERVKGVVKEGMLADLVVLSEDPFKNTSSIKDIRVLLTMIGGEIVHNLIDGFGGVNKW